MSMIQIEPKYVELGSNTFGELFSSFKNEAFRLELLQSYDIEEERASFEAYRANPRPESPDPGIFEWCQEVQAGVRSGKHYSRVRQIIIPPSEYIRFEIVTGFRFSVPAGEDVDAILSEAPVVFGTKVPLLSDFWLFDNEHCIILRYDQNGRFLGFFKVPPDQIEAYIALKVEVQSLSAPLVDTSVWKDLLSGENK